MVSQNGPKVPSFAQARLKAWLSCHHDTQRANGPAVYAAQVSDMPHVCHRKAGTRLLFVPLVFQCFFLGSLVRNSGEHRGLESFAKARALRPPPPTLEDQWHGRNSPSTERRFSTNVRVSQAECPVCRYLNTQTNGRAFGPRSKRRLRFPGFQPGLGKLLGLRPAGDGARSTLLPTAGAESDSLPLRWHHTR